ncbi:MAG TPA: ATP-binding protein, partial [Polyangia bacterium]|nr:ATP-binding protein [Polyangia bacterium]
TAPQNLDRRTGRGLFLIRTFMDEVRHNAAGNEITMVKLRDTGEPAAEEPTA